MLQRAIRLSFEPALWAMLLLSFAAVAQVNPNDTSGLPTDLPSLRRVAEQGDGRAQRALGDIYSSITYQDNAEAQRWYRKAADQGDVIAQMSLALLDCVEGTTQNYGEAVKWFRKLSDQAQPVAQRYLGLMYHNGQGVTQDYTEAVTWLRKAGDNGDAFARNVLGMMYDLGQGLTQDYGEAVKLFRKAADQGNASAQYNLALSYRDGKGVTQDYVNAHMWSNLAASRSSGGDQKTYAELRDSLAAKMTAAQVAEAQRLAREWKPNFDR